MARFIFLLMSCLVLICVGCNTPQATDSVNTESDGTNVSSNSSETNQSQDDSPVRDIESFVVKKDGLFRVVVCRASNLRGLAIKRRDMFAAGDTALLIRDLFSAGAADWIEGDSQLDIDPEEFAGLDIDTFEDLANKMSVETGSIAKLSEAFYAAYLVGTIKHDDIRSAIAPLIADIGEKHNLSVRDQQDMSQAIMLMFTVGWAGNDIDSVFDGWKDPEKTTAGDANK